MKKRDIAFILVLLSLFAFVVVLLETGKITHFETTFYNFISQYISTKFTLFFKTITYLGGPVAITLFCIVLLVFHQTRKSYGVPICITLVSSYILNTILKHIFVRPRPDILRLVTEKSYSFPSGHSMINASIYTILILLLLKNADKKGKRIIVSVSLLVLLGLIGLSRIYLGVHYLGDVIAGWILGVLVAFIVYIIFRNIKNKKTSKV